MNGIDEIINKIISDAQAQADSITSDSNARIEQMKSDASERSKQRAATYSKQLFEYKTESERRRNTVADLDIKKELLGKKKEIIDKVYDLTVKKLCSLPDKEYLGLIEKLIVDNACDGDVVVICQGDIGKITPAFVNGIAKKKNISLTLSDKTGDFSGGVILSSAKMDKNLTFDTELKALAEEYETKISSILFGE